MNKWTNRQRKNKTYEPTDKGKNRKMNKQTYGHVDNRNAY